MHWKHANDLDRAGATVSGWTGRGAGGRVEAGDSTSGCPSQAKGRARTQPTARQDADGFRPARRSSSSTRRLATIARVGCKLSGHRRTSYACIGADGTRVMARSTYGPIRSQSGCSDANDTSLGGHEVPRRDNFSNIPSSGRDFLAVARVAGSRLLATTVMRAICSVIQ